jgi:hypothetical protein
MLKTLILSLLVFAPSMQDSFTGVECFADKGIIKVFIKLNYNDFIRDYRYIVNDDQNFDPSGGIDTTKIFVLKYLDNRVQIFADDKKLEGQLTKIESADGELKLDLLYNFNKRAKRFRLKNMILKDLSKYHSNLVIFKYNDFEEGARFTPEKTEHIFTLR